MEAFWQLSTLGLLGSSSPQAFLGVLHPGTFWRSLSPVILEPFTPWLFWVTSGVLWPGAFGEFPTLGLFWNTPPFQFFEGLHSWTFSEHFTVKLFQSASPSGFIALLHCPAFFQYFTIWLYFIASLAFFRGALLLCFFLEIHSLALLGSFIT